MINNIKNKKILLICPKFFDYHIEFINELKELGADVDYYDERPSNKNIVKALLRLNSNLAELISKKYYRKLSHAIKEKKYDYMLIIKPEAITIDFIKEFKDRNPNARVCMYLWDSMMNNKSAKYKIELADNVYSFDAEDCKKYKLKFRPLFYTSQYHDLQKSKKENEYDLLFIGTVHSDRYKVLNNLKIQMESEGKKVYFYMYIQSKIVYLIRKFIFNEFKGSHIDEFKFKPLNQRDVIKLVEKSNTIIDIHHPKQTGLTMRTIEMLGANKKLITTNEAIVDYDFYNKNNIQVVNRNIDNLEIEFLNGKYNSLDDEVKMKYSIKSWLLEILN